MIFKNYLSHFIIASVFAFAISGCATRDEVQGVCKSCKPYYVRDEWHHPQKHYDYDEVGLASWYGPGFHGKPKAHGEPYDQFEMTAAHKTLPIPTVAMVENLQTGSKVKVLIDDRGPFVYKGRIIDLSVAAAKAIGVYQKGLGKVRVTALADESDRFARHLAQFKRAKCPKGRRWIKIFQEDIAGTPPTVLPPVYQTVPDSPLRNSSPHIHKHTVYTKPVEPIVKHPSLDNTLNDALLVPTHKKVVINKAPLKTKDNYLKVNTIDDDPLDYIDPDYSIKPVSKPVYHKKTVLEKTYFKKTAQKYIPKKKNSIIQPTRAIVKKIKHKKR